MGTLSKSLTENYASKRSTWTFTTSCNDVSVTGDTFSVPLPTVTAKYVYSGKNVAYVTDFRIYPVVGSSYYSSNWSNFTYGGGDLALNPWASNASKTLSRTGGGTILSDRSTSTFFKASNKTTRTITLTYKCTTVSADSAIKSSDGYIYEGNDGQLRLYTSDTGMPFDTATANITLNVPPTVMYDTPVYSTPHYAGLGAYSVTVTSAEAQYGGDVQTITLTVGSDSVTQNYSTATVTNQTLSVTPSVAGTFTPTLEVTDSRGQVTTVSFEQITVNTYTAPNISFDVQRTNGSGIPNVEGEHALVTASISYTDAIAELTQPTVAVRDEDGNLVVSSATWYESWDATNGVSDAVNWTDYNPQSPVTLYAVVSATGSSFSPNESYTVSITPTDNQGGVAQTITQTLSTGFFTIDFKAGGKEIAFGAPANDDVTDYPEGLFKCAMSFKLKDNLFWVGTRSEYEQAVADDKMPEHTIVFITDETADYVVEEGTSGIWTYRKWDSGIAECWSKDTVSVNFATQVVSNFRMTSTATSVSYPDIFTSLTSVLCSAYHSINNTWLTMTSGRADTTAKTINYGFMGWNTGSTQSVIVSINIKGTWK